MPLNRIYLVDHKPGSLLPQDQSKSILISSQESAQVRTLAVMNSVSDQKNESERINQEREEQCEEGQDKYVDDSGDEPVLNTSRRLNNQEGTGDDQ